MKRFWFWWYFLTDSSFRHWTYLHDRQTFVDEIRRRQIEMLEYQSRTMFDQKYNRK